jgi:hypothetical protein
MEIEQKSASKGLLAVGWRIVVGGLAHRFFGGLEYPTQALQGAVPLTRMTKCFHAAHSHRTDDHASLPRLAPILAAGPANFKLGRPGTFPAAPTLRIR